MPLSKNRKSRKRSANRRSNRKSAARRRRSRRSSKRNSRRKVSRKSNRRKNSKRAASNNRAKVLYKVPPKALKIDDVNNKRIDEFLEFQKQLSANICTIQSVASRPGLSLDEQNKVEKRIKNQQVFSSYINDILENLKKNKFEEEWKTKVENFIFEDMAQVKLMDEQFGQARAPNNILVQKYDWHLGELRQKLNQENLQEEYKIEIEKQIKELEQKKMEIEGMQISSDSEILQKRLQDLESEIQQFHKMELDYEKNPLIVLRIYIQMSISELSRKKNQTNEKSKKDSYEQLENKMSLLYEQLRDPSLSSTSDLSPFERERDAILAECDKIDAMIEGISYDLTNKQKIEMATEKIENAIDVYESLLKDETISNEEKEKFKIHITELKNLEANFVEKTNLERLAMDMDRMDVILKRFMEVQKVALDKKEQFNGAYSGSSGESCDMLDTLSTSVSTFDSEEVSTTFTDEETSILGSFDCVFGNDDIETEPDTSDDEYYEYEEEDSLKDRMRKLEEEFICREYRELISKIDSIVASASNEEHKTALLKIQTQCKDAYAKLESEGHTKMTLANVFEAANKLLADGEKIDIVHSRWIFLQQKLTYLCDLTRDLIQKERNLQDKSHFTRNLEYYSQLKAEIEKEMTNAKVKGPQESDEQVLTIYEKATQILIRDYLIDMNLERGDVKCVEPLHQLEQIEKFHYGKEFIEVIYTVSTTSDPAQAAFKAKIEEACKKFRSTDFNKVSRKDGKFTEYREFFSKNEQIIKAIYSNNPNRLCSVNQMIDNKKELYITKKKKMIRAKFERAEAYVKELKTMEIDGRIGKDVIKEMNKILEIEGNTIKEFIVKDFDKKFTNDNFEELLFIEDCVVDRVQQLRTLIKQSMLQEETDKQAQGKQTIPESDKVNKIILGKMLKKASSMIEKYLETNKLDEKKTKELKDLLEEVDVHLINVENSNKKTSSKLVVIREFMTKNQATFEGIASDMRQDFKSFEAQLEGESTYVRKKKISEIQSNLDKAINLYNWVLEQQTDERGKRDTNALVRDAREQLEEFSKVKTTKNLDIAGWLKKSFILLTNAEQAKFVMPKPVRQRQILFENEKTEKIGIMLYTQETLQALNLYINENLPNEEEKEKLEKVKNLLLYEAKQLHGPVDRNLGSPFERIYIFYEEHDEIIRTARAFSKLESKNLRENAVDNSPDVLEDKMKELIFKADCLTSAKNSSGQTYPEDVKREIDSRIELIKSCQNCMKLDGKAGGYCFVIELLVDDVAAFMKYETQMFYGKDLERKEKVQIVDNQFKNFEKKFVCSQIEAKIFAVSNQATKDSLKQLKTEFINQSFGLRDHLKYFDRIYDTREVLYFYKSTHSVTDIQARYYLMKLQEQMKELTKMANQSKNEAQKQIFVNKLKKLKLANKNLTDNLKDESYRITLNECQNFEMIITESFEAVEDVNFVKTSISKSTSEDDRRQLVFIEITENCKNIKTMLESEFVNEEEKTYLNHQLKIYEEMNRKFFEKASLDSLEKQIATQSQETTMIKIYKAKFATLDKTNSELILAKNKLDNPKVIKTNEQIDEYKTRIKEQTEKFEKLKNIKVDSNSRLVDMPNLLQEDIDSLINEQQEAVVRMRKLVKVNASFEHKKRIQRIKEMMGKESNQETKEALQVMLVKFEELSDGINTEDEEEFQITHRKLKVLIEDTNPVYKKIDLVYSARMDIENRITELNDKKAKASDGEKKNIEIALKKLNDEKEKIEKIQPLKANLTDICKESSAYYDIVGAMRDKLLKASIKKMRSSTRQKESMKNFEEDLNRLKNDSTEEYALQITTTQNEVNHVRIKIEKELEQWTTKLTTLNMSPSERLIVEHTIKVYQMQIENLNKIKLKNSYTNKEMVKEEIEKIKKEIEQMKQKKVTQEDAVFTKLNQIHSDLNMLQEHVNDPLVDENTKQSYIDLFNEFSSTSDIESMIMRHKSSDIGSLVKVIEAKRSIERRNAQLAILLCKSEIERYPDFKASLENELKMNTTELFNLNKVTIAEAKKMESKLEKLKKDTFVDEKAIEEHKNFLGYYIVIIEKRITTIDDRNDQALKNKLEATKLLMAAYMEKLECGFPPDPDNMISIKNLLVNVNSELETVVKEHGSAIEKKIADVKFAYNDSKSNMEMLSYIIEFSSKNTGDYKLKMRKLIKYSGLCEQYLNKLENNIPLSEKEQEKLLKITQKTMAIRVEKEYTETLNENMASYISVAENFKSIISSNVTFYELYLSKFKTTTPFGAEVLKEIDSILKQMKTYKTCDAYEINVMLSNLQEYLEEKAILQNIHETDLKWIEYLFNTYDAHSKNVFEINKQAYKPHLEKLDTILRDLKTLNADLPDEELEPYAAIKASILACDKTFSNVFNVLKTDSKNAEKILYTLEVMRLFNSDKLDGDKKILQEDIERLQSIVIEYCKVSAKNYYNDHLEKFFEDKCRRYFDHLKSLWNLPDNYIGALTLIAKGYRFRNMQLKHQELLKNMNIQCSNYDSINNIDPANLSAKDISQVERFMQELQEEQKTVEAVISKSLEQHEKFSTNIKKIEKRLCKISPQNFSEDTRKFYKLTKDMIEEFKSLPLLESQDEIATRNKKLEDISLAVKMIESAPTISYRDRYERNKNVKEITLELENVKTVCKHSLEEASDAQKAFINTFEFNMILIEECLNKWKKTIDRYTIYNMKSEFYNILNRMGWQSIVSSITIEDVDYKTEIGIMMNNKNTISIILSDFIKRHPNEALICAEAEQIILNLNQLDNMTGNRNFTKKSTQYKKCIAMYKDFNKKYLISCNEKKMQLMELQRKLGEAVNEISSVVCKDRAEEDYKEKSINKANHYITFLEGCTSGSDNSVQIFRSTFEEMVNFEKKISTELQQLRKSDTSRESGNEKKMQLKELQKMLGEAVNEFEEKISTELPQSRRSERYSYQSAYRSDHSRIGGQTGQINQRFGGNPTPQQPPAEIKFDSEYKFEPRDSEQQN